MDIEFLLWLQGLRGGALDGILLAVTDFVVSPVMYVFVAVLYWCISKRAAVYLAMNLSLGTFVNQTLKNTFCTYRPWIRNPEVVPLAEAKAGATGYSFPSGHTQVAATEFLSLAHWQKKRLWVVLVCVFMTLLVGFTRMYLGVHTPQDVLLSLLLSLVVLLVNAKLLAFVDKKKNGDIWMLVVGLLLVAAMLFYTTLKSYPLDYAGGELLVNPAEMITDCYAAGGCLAGFLAGWVLERRFVDFGLFVPRRAKFLRAVVGSAVLYFYAEFARDFLTSALLNWGEFLFFFGAFVYILYLFPLAFSAWEKRFFVK